MKNSLKVKTLIALFVIFILLLGYKFVSEKNFKEDYESFINYKTDAKNLILLQKKWDDKTKTKQTIDSIKRRFKVDSLELINGKYIMKLGSLKKRDLDRFMATVLSSNLIVEKLEVKKDKGLVSVFLEVKR